MECEECTQDLTAYLDGELTDFRVNELESHLGVCPSCAAEFRSLEASVLLVETRVQDLEPRAEMWKSFQARVSAMAPLRSPHPFQFFLAPRWWAAVAAIILAVVGLWQYNRHEASERDLRQYMSSYIQARQSQTRTPVRSVEDSYAGPAGAASFTIDAVHTEFADNPFAAPRTGSFTNPFRAEEDR